VARLSQSKTDELINTWDFERRQVAGKIRPSTFPIGEFDDWTGIKPDADWIDIIKSYRTASRILSAESCREAAAPYLFLCRHTLELQLKAIIMLGQQAFDLALDLPSHHDLPKLWTAAYPIAIHRRPKGRASLLEVRQVVDDYHEVDPGSFNFRYPVAKNNNPIVHKEFVHAFSQKAHSSKIERGCDFLDDVIRSLRFAVLWRGVKASTSK
jgi:hypothetical protein